MGTSDPLARPAEVETLGRVHLPSLQVLRAVAALMVVAHHISSGVSVFVHPVHPAVAGLLDYGFLGVDLFFVLSGFIITHVHFTDSPGLSSAARFVRRRVFRIYPPYVPIALAMVGVLMLAPGVSHAERDISLASSLFLVPSAGAPALYVAWTLIHEMLFYTIFLSFYVSRRALWVALALWVMAIILADWLQMAVDSGRYYFGLLNLEFMVGILVALASRHLDLSRGGVARVLTGLAVMATALYFIPSNNSQTWSRVVFAAGVGLVLLQMVATDRRSPVSWPAVLLLIGNASYSIYLVHGPLVSVMSRAASGLGSHWPLVFAAQFLVCLCAGILYYLMIEKRLISIVSARKSRERQCAG